MGKTPVYSLTGEEAIPFPIFNLMQCLLHLKQKRDKGKAPCPIENRKRPHLDRGAGTID